ncbi:hypothetical protein BJ138DRAFT_966535, partial [Hygrophoropsis aurantiaca]
IDVNVIQSISDRLKEGTSLTAQSEAERACFKVIGDLDHVGSGVKGSITNKKFMRNEIWSLVSYKGAPTWYITLSPADEKHPICLYYADIDKEFRPYIKDANVRRLLVSRNPVAGARFFHLMIQLFIKHVLGVNQTIDGAGPTYSGQSYSRGFYGETDAYYGTVEQ